MHCSRCSKVDLAKASFAVTCGRERRERKEEAFGKSRVSAWTRAEKAPGSKASRILGAKWRHPLAPAAGMEDLGWKQERWKEGRSVFRRLSSSGDDNLR